MIWQFFSPKFQRYKWRSWFHRWHWWCAKTQACGPSSTPRVSIQTLQEVPLTTSSANLQVSFLLELTPQLVINCYRWKILNTQYMTIPTIVSLVKMEYGWNFSISGLKKMVISGLEKIFLKFLHVILITEFVLLIKIPPFNEVNSFNRKWQVHGGISKIFLLYHFSPSFFGQKC